MDSNSLLIILMVSVSLGYLLTIGGRHNLIFKAALVFIGLFPVLRFSFDQESILFCIAGFVFGHLIAHQTEFASSDELGFFDHLARLRAGSGNPNPQSPGNASSGTAPTTEEIELERTKRYEILQRVRAGGGSEEEPQKNDDSTESKSESGPKESADIRTAYEILRVPENASKQEIEKSYKRLRSKYHTDTHQNLSDDLSRSLNREFDAVQRAYDKLK